MDDGIPHSLEKAAAMGKLAACCGTSQQQVMREPASHFLRLLGMCLAMRMFFCHVRECTIKY